MPRALTDVIADVYEVAELLGRPQPVLVTEPDIRDALGVLIDAADRAVFAAIENGEGRAIHHALACGKELAVIAVCLEHAGRRA